MIQSSWVPQRKYIKQANKMYFKNLNQTGWACLENATSTSRLKALENDIFFGD
jgi:hypothetical protein